MACKDIGELMVTRANLLVAILVLSTCISCQSDATYDVPDEINDLLEKLEKFARGQESSDISYQELIDVSKLWESIEPGKKDYYYSQLPLTRLVIDVAIHPMGVVQEQLGSNETSHAMHVKRVEAAYKILKPFYLGEIGKSGFTVRTGKIDTLLDIVCGKKKASLTTKLFKEAKDQVLIWLERLDEIMKIEDIFHHLEEIKAILNLKNNLYVKTLFKHVFPALDTKPDPSPNALKDLFLNGLWEDERVKVGDKKYMKYEIRSS